MKPFFLVLLVTVYQLSTAQEFSISSPDKKLQLTFMINAEGTPAYALQYAAKNVLGNSLMGVSIKDDAGFTKSLMVAGVDSSYKDEYWNTVWGEVKTIRKQYRELAVNLQQISGKKLQIRIVFRLFNAGLGFRYEFPAQPSLRYFVVTNESTQYNLGADQKAFWIPEILIPMNTLIMRAG
jgi:hypothetical protein